MNAIRRFRNTQTHYFASLQDTYSRLFFQAAADRFAIILAIKDARYWLSGLVAYSANHFDRGCRALPVVSDDDLNVNGPVGWFDTRQRGLLPRNDTYKNENGGHFVFSFSRSQLFRPRAMAVEARSSIQPATAGSLIPADERVRLLRSTRKVAHLLGETPLVIETSSSTLPPSGRGARRLSKRTAYINAPPRTSSLREASSFHPSSETTVPARPVLAVRVPTSPLGIEPPSPSLSSWLTSPVATPSSTFSFSFDPQNPVSTSGPDPATDPDHDAFRRARTRKMARVVRTLGERVPAELVFGASVEPSTSRRRSALAKRNSAQGQGRVRSGRRDSLIHSNMTGGVPAVPARAGRRESLAKQWERERGKERESDRWEEDSASVYSTLSGGDWEYVPSAAPTTAPASHWNARPADGLKMSTTASTSSPLSSSNSPIGYDAGRGRASSYSYNTTPARPPRRPTISTATPSSSAMPPPLSTSSLMTPATSASPRTPFSARSHAVSVYVPPPLPAPAPYTFLSTPSLPERSISPADPVLGDEGYSPFSQHLESYDTFPADNRPLNASQLHIHGTAPTHRSEKGWSGEWVASGVGVQNMSMDEVAKRLRGLKVK